MRSPCSLLKVPPQRQHVGHRLRRHILHLKPQQFLGGLLPLTKNRAAIYISMIIYIYIFVGRTLIIYVYIFILLCMFLYIFWGVDIPCTAKIWWGCISIFCTHNKWTCTDTEKNQHHIKPTKRTWSARMEGWKLKVIWDHSNHQSAIAINIAILSCYFMMWLTIGQDE